MPDAVDSEPNTDPEQDSDYEEVDRSWEPDADQLKDLKIAHDNSGHPNNADFARMLRRGNAHPHIANWERRV